MKVPERRSPMSSAAYPGDATSLSFVDWTELSNLDRIVQAKSVGNFAVILRTTDNREIRITAMRNLATGEYVADFERRSTIRAAGQEFQVWSQTRAYRRCTGADVESCLEAAVVEVDRTNVF
jgi:hypothetical protein